MCRVLEVYPKGYGTAKDKWLSLYMYLSDGTSLPLKQEWNIEFKFRLRDQVNNSHLERTCKSKTPFSFQSVFSLMKLAGRVLVKIKF